MSALALHGGAQACSAPGPHFVWPRLAEDDREAVARQLAKSISIYDRSGIFEIFENEFRSAHNRKHALLCNSGTSALHSIYFGLALKPGDRVIVPDFSFFATVSPLVHFPVEIVFGDVDRNGNLCPEDVGRLINDRTVAVVMTHMWGVPGDAISLKAVCDAYGAKLIEDCSHSHGATFCGRVTGSFGHAAAWSLQGQKTVTGGEGGVVATDADELFFRALLLGHYNRRPRTEIPDEFSEKRYALTGYGLKLRAHPLAVALASSQFRKLGSVLEGRNAYASKILGALEPFDFIVPPDITSRQCSWYALPFQFDPLRTTGVSVEWFLAALRAEGLTEIEQPGATRPISALPLFLDPDRHRGCIATVDKSTIGRPQSVQHFANCVKMPVWSYSDEEGIVDAYIEGLVKVCKHIAMQKSPG